MGVELGTYRLDALSGTCSCVVFGMEEERLCGELWTISPYLLEEILAEAVLDTVVGELALGVICLGEG